MRRFFLFLALVGMLMQSAEVSAAVRNNYSTQRYSRVNVRNTELQHYVRTTNFLIMNDYPGLRDAVSNGLNINARNRNGDTAVCTAIKSNQYQWFNMLKASGANLNANCIKKINLSKRENFIENYVRRGGYMSPGARQALLVEDSVNWWLVGGIAGGVVLAGGVAALALSGGGGGGGGSSSSGGSNIGVVSGPDNPPTGDETNPAYYETREFSGQNFTNVKVQNFLGQIKAQYAYAYAAAAGAHLAGDGVIIGELDSGIEYSHPELSTQIATDGNGNKLGFNTVYGPCRNGDKKIAGL